MPALNRREFLVQLAGTSIGTFLLPDRESNQPAPTDPDSATPPLRQLIDLPRKGVNHEGLPFLIWPEMVDGRVQTMFWYPESKTEETEMLAFYEAARSYGAKPRQESLGQRVSDWLGLAKRSEQERRSIDAILDDPENVEVWLPYAECLIARGDSMGTHIKAYCLMDGMPDDDPRLQALIDEYWDTFEADVEKWFQPLRELGLWPVVAGQFRPDLWMNQRAITKVRISRPNVLPDYAERLFDAVPLLMSLELDYDEIDADGLAGMRQSAQIHELELSGNHLTHEQIVRLLASPYWTRLRSLDISRNPLLPETGRVLAASPILDRIETLLAASSGLGYEGITAIVHSPRAAKIEMLRAEGNDLDDGAVLSILQSPHLKSLKYLNLGESSFTPETLGLLGNAVFAAQLQGLFLNRCNLTQDHLQVLASLPLPAIIALYLDDNELNSAAAKCLAAAPWSRQITMLSLMRCNLERNAAAELARGDWPNLDDVGLSFNRLEDDGVEQLSQSSSIHVTGELDLRSVGCGLRGAEAIASGPAFQSVTTLLLSDNPIGSKGGKLLAQGAFPNLERLDLDACRVGVQGQNALQERFAEIALYLDD